MRTTPACAGVRSSLAPHKVAGEVTIHCLEGSPSIQLGDTNVELDAGELMVLPAEAKHGVKSLVGATALVAVALKSRAWVAVADAA